MIWRGLLSFLVAAGIGLSLITIFAWSVTDIHHTNPAEKTTEVRFYENVDPDRTVAQVLVRGKMRPGYGNSVDLVAVNAQLEPITGDTLEAWVQHYTPDTTRHDQTAARLLRKSQQYDMLVHCFPEAVPEGVRTDNALPEADSLVYVYPIVNSDYTVISGEQRKTLQFMTTRSLTE